MPSVHVKRWIENLSNTKHELFWYDILNRGDEFLEGFDVHTYTCRYKRKIPYIKGEYTISKRLPKVYRSLQPMLEVTVNETLEQILKELKPDVVHSFEMYTACLPILKTMQKQPHIKWLYSCWGSDLFMSPKKNLPGLRKVLKRIDYLHTDCQRDFDLATKLGFNSYFVGVIPGGGGYHLEEYFVYKKDIKSRKIILVKGYQHKFGRAMTVIKAMELILEKLKDWEVIFYGCHQQIIDYIDQTGLPFKTFARHELSHRKIIKLMGEARIAIGNSISDGMPNTLLEAIVMGAFPIQSNPGGASSELIKHGKNGYLIEHPDNHLEIKNLIILSLESQQLIKEAFKINTQISSDKLDFGVIKAKIQNIYSNIPHARRF